MILCQRPNCLHPPDRRIERHYRDDHGIDSSKTAKQELSSIYFSDRKKAIEHREKVADNLQEISWSHLHQVINQVLKKFIISSSAKKNKPEFTPIHLHIIGLAMKELGSRYICDNVEIINEYVPTEESEKLLQAIKMRKTYRGKRRPISVAKSEFINLKHTAKNMRVVDTAEKLNQEAPRDPQNSAPSAVETAEAAAEGEEAAAAEAAEAAAVDAAAEGEAAEGEAAEVAVEAAAEGEEAAAEAAATVETAAATPAISVEFSPNDNVEITSLSIDDGDFEKNDSDFYQSSNEFSSDEADDVDNEQCVAKKQNFSSSLQHVAAKAFLQEQGFYTYFQRTNVINKNFAEWLAIEVKYPDRYLKLVNGFLRVANRISKTCINQKELSIEVFLDFDAIKQTFSLILESGKVSGETGRNYCKALKKFVTFVRSIYFKRNLTIDEEKTINHIENEINRFDKQFRNIRLKANRQKRYNYAISDSKIDLKKAQAVFDSEEFFGHVNNVQKMVDSNEFEHLVEKAKRTRLSAVPKISKAFEFLVQVICAYPILGCGQRSGVAGTMTIQEFNDAKLKNADPFVIFIKNHKTSETHLAAVVIENLLVKICYQIYAEKFRPIVAFKNYQADQTAFLLNQFGNKFDNHVPDKFKAFQRAFGDFFPKPICANQLRKGIENLAKHLPSGDRHAVNSLLCHSTAIAERAYVQTDIDYAVKV